MGKELKLFFFKHVERAIIGSWWLVILLMVTYVYYDYSLEKVEANYSKLYEQKVELLREKEDALVRRKRLQAEIKSQTSADYIQLVLIKRLGVIPHHSKKVFFQSKGAL